MSSDKSLYIPGIIIIPIVILLLSAPLYSQIGFVVNSTADLPDNNINDGLCLDSLGNCTLRAAIQQANANVGKDTVKFNIPGLGPHTIQPNQLQSITENLVIDGYSQPGASPNTNPSSLGTNAVLMIELDGSNASCCGGAGALNFPGNSLVRGLVINRFPGHGVSGNADVEGNFIGTDVTGTLVMGNGNSGVNLGTGGNKVGGTSSASRNLISGNIGSGVELFGSGNTIQGNLIGTDANRYGKVKQ